MPIPGRSPVSHAPTRQQLDELDALMQRMLALPVDAVDVPSDAAPSNIAPSADEEQERVDVLTTITPDAGTPSATQEESPEESVLAPGISWNLISPLPAPRRGSGVPETAPSAIESSEELIVVGWWLRPLAWMNRGFDRWFQRLGPLGRWLSDTGGRSVLGWIGVLLLAAAVAWVVLDTLGWTW
jgi:hypothetical protein